MTEPKATSRPMWVKKRIVIPSALLALGSGEDEKTIDTKAASKASAVADQAAAAKAAEEAAAAKTAQGAAPKAAEQAAAAMAAQEAAAKSMPRPCGSLPSRPPPRKQ